MSDHRELAGLLVSQREVLSRAQALSLVTTTAGLRHKTRPGGPWQRLLPTVFLTTTGEPTRQQLQTAALLYARAPGLVTGSSALLTHGIRGARPQVVDVLVPADCFVKSRQFVAIHRTRRMPSSWHQDMDVRYAPAERAVADTVRALARLSDARTVVASAVQQRHCTVAELAAELEARHDPKDAMLRQVLAEVAAGIRSAPEGGLRALITGSGLPQPVYNPTLFLDGLFLACPDAWWPDQGVAVEVDSKEFHLLPDDWHRTMLRHRKMTAAGLAVLHLSPQQLHEDHSQVLADIAGALRRGRPVPGIRTVQAAR